ncbi:MAG: glycosyltransferase [Bacteroidales bacterium]
MHNILNETYCVIPTYGNRICYLEKVIEVMLENQVGGIVIIGNGMHPESLQRIKMFQQAYKIIKLILLTENRGSAFGFTTGINVALNQTNCEFIWLLDDDVLPERSTLPVLMKHWLSLERIYGRQNVALVPFRPDHQYNIRYGKGLLYLRSGAFLSFHFLNIPYKLFKLLNIESKREKTLPPLIEVPYAGYAGFLAHRTVYQRIGLPRLDFILYQDDLEYTLRFTRNGGKIFLCTTTQIISTETSWDMKQQFKFGIQAWFNAREDYRVYYGARNQVYFERQFYNNATMRFLNKMLFLTMFRILCIARKRKNRLDLVVKAIKDGEKGKLGYNTLYPLP